MQETRSNCFGSKKRSTTLLQAKTGKHECRNVTAIMLLLHFGTRAYLFLPDEGVVLHFTYPKQLLRVSCTLWCYFSNYYQTIPQKASFLVLYCRVQSGIIHLKFHFHRIVCWKSLAECKQIIQFLDFHVIHWKSTKN